MKMYLISDNTDSLTGMRLAGIQGVIAHTKEEFEAELQKVLENKEIGILLVTEMLSKQFPQIVDQLKLAGRLPLVVEIPDRHGTGREADFISAYVRDAIGVKL